MLRVRSLGQREARQAALVDELFGDIVFSASIPAAVREGHLAPFAELAWLTLPTAEEAEWLRDQSLRFVQLTTDKSRTDALRFYERLGFIASHEGLKLALDG